MVSPRSAPTTDAGWVSRLGELGDGLGRPALQDVVATFEQSGQLLRRPSGQPALQVLDIHMAIEPCR